MLWIFGSERWSDSDVGIGKRAMSVLDKIHSCSDILLAFSQHLRRTTTMRISLSSLFLGLMMVIGMAAGFLTPLGMESASAREVPSYCHQQCDTGVLWDDCDAAIHATVCVSVDWNSCDTTYASECGE